MTYIKPLIIKSTDMIEGIYAGSGDCYTTEAWIHQRPEVGREDFRIQVIGRHHADHTREKQILTISFNSPVTYSACYMNGATLLSGDGTNTLRIQLTYHQNPVDNIGGGDLVVRSDNLALQVISCVLSD